MGLNSTPSSERIHIGFFGRRNAGKSSVVNAVTGQKLSVVSDVLGTTTDPVFKAMELLSLGPVMIIDTAGTDDIGELGGLRVEKTMEALRKTDIAVLVIDASVGRTEADEALIAEFKKRNIAYIEVYNKADLADAKVPEGALAVSAEKGDNIDKLKEKIAALAPEKTEKTIVGDIISAGDFAVLVVPIDASAPKGRLILPQQQTIRDILELGATAVVVRDTELKSTLEKLGRKPRIVITDSQVFARVAADTPKDIELTSFSILFARYKGDLEEAVRGAMAIDSIEDGDTILISEGCTHHRQCEDIGTVKLPKWLKEYTQKNFRIETTSGGEFPSDLSRYKLVIHCGGCMLNEREMQHRISVCREQGVPITNYGISISYMKGILKRSIAPFPEYKQH